jgi:two-component system, LytTR family, response regulator
MLLTCVILEDEPLARSLMETYVSKVTHLELVKSFGNPIDALDYFRENSVDILFSDIHMPEINGISLLKLLKNKPLVILTTAYSEYALEGYELEVFDYLVKPINFERFLNSVEKATNRLKSARNIEKQNIQSQNLEEPKESIFIKDGTKMVKLRLNEIRFIEGLKDYVSIYTNDKKIVSLQTLKWLETQLPQDRFMRVHNSYIIALNAIDIVEKDKVLIGKNYIPISDTYKKLFREYLDQNQLGFSN